ncbi:MAG: site-specific integrase [Pirellulaceae bacterium]
MQDNNTPQRENRSRLLDQVTNCMRLRHMSKRTEKAYLNWIVDFLQFHKQLAGDWLHPKDLGDDDVNQYVTYLAVERKVAASTQNQALSAIWFLYTRVLEKEVHFDAMRAQMEAGGWRQ